MKWIVGILLIFLMVGVASATVSQYNATDGLYTVITFGGTGVSDWTAPYGVTSIDYLIVGGGGSGGVSIFEGGGGGGAGGFVTASGYSVTPGVIYPIEVGAGGVKPANGSNSSFNGIIAYGGGRGAGNETNHVGKEGGSGGGGVWNQVGGDGVTGQGRKGGTGVVLVMSGAYLGGGGGGAGTNGTNAVADVETGDGGNGLNSTITGVNVTYAGGGGGSNNAGAPGYESGYGGLGGGGLAGVNGTDGLGGGGGGNASGGSGVVILRYLTVIETTPITNFIANNTTGSAPLVVNFTDLSTSTSGVSAWNWSFGEGNYSNQQNPVHTYAYNGQYSVRLISQSFTMSNQTTKLGYINVGITVPVSANFVGTPTTSAVNPMTVTFTDTSVCNPVCSQWAWDFNNDGAYDSVAQNPTWTYTYPGNYTVRLVVGNGLNTGSVTKPSYIHVGPILIPPTIPVPTAVLPGGINTSFEFQMNGAVDMQNSTFLKYWLQNFTSTGNFSVMGFAQGLMQPLFGLFGFWIYLIIWGLYLFAVWIRTQDVTLPLIIGILSMGTFGLLFPKEALPVIIIMFVVCGAIIITKLMKDSI